MTWSEKFTLHISRFVSSAWTQLWCLHCSILYLSKVIAEKLLVTFHDLTWPCQNDKWPLIAIFLLSLPVSRCLRVFRIALVQKRRLSLFSLWIITSCLMKRSQNWSDLRSPISKFRDKTFIDTVTDINFWKLQGDRSFGGAMRNIQTFFWCEVTWRDLVTWPWVTWIWKLNKVCGKDVRRGVSKNGGRKRRCFWNICEKPVRGVHVQTPPPARRGLTFGLKIMSDNALLARK